MYSVDTGHFYSRHEAYLHNQNFRYRQERRYLTNKLPGLEDKLTKEGFNHTDLKSLRKAGRAAAFPSGTIDAPLPQPQLNTSKSPQNTSEPLPEAAAPSDTMSEALLEYLKCIRLIEHKRRKANEAKDRLSALLANKTAQNKLTGGRDHIRSIPSGILKDNEVIAVFESSLTRTIGLKPDELTDALMVVQVYYFDVFKDLFFYGYLYNGERYRYYTSSAGQIRKKKAVFIKESVWNSIERTIMCGLTIETINARGGNNVNKHLAYMALANSATDEWPDFDIDRTIVIDDFESEVSGTFDFINEEDYSVSRQTGSVPICHTDGAGMMLPCVMGKNTMFRAPWIKGLLGVFDFRRFLEEKGCSPLIRDIYGKEHDILREDIQIIFTKSQFKMYKYYDSWDQYKEFFKKYRCAAGLCNTEEDRVKKARINYQMLQTLTDISEEEILHIVQPTVSQLNNLCTSRQSMMEALGVTPYNTNMSPFQKSVKNYPALLSDTYTKDILKVIKDSLVRKGRSGKLKINGRYTFLLPDYYAACEHWFLNEKQPRGLLADQEVFCWLYRHDQTLDCLRSPHLYKEHAIRRNAACATEPDNGLYNDGNVFSGLDSVSPERALMLRGWYTTNGLYASTHDLISKILMYDVDGDKALVVADKEFIRIARRNMEGIVPLYYNMRKAAPTRLNKETIYSGLNTAFTGGNIGTYSNDISKIWNSEVFRTGSPARKQEAIDCVKYLCCQNNFVIDYAKTLYKPEFPAHISDTIKQYTRRKLPAFFEFAKDKDPSQLEERGTSLVDSLYGLIPDLPIRTRALKLDALDYRKLMGNPLLRCPSEVSQLYDSLNRKFSYLINYKEEDDNLRYVAGLLREQFSALGYTSETISDMLVHYLYGSNKRYKQLLWLCYGHYIEANIKANLDIKKTKFVQCCDCGEWMEVVSCDNSTTRCPECYSTYRREYYKQKKREQRSRQKMMA